MANGNNPIKYVVFSKNDYFEPEVFGGGNNNPHKPVTQEFREGYEAEGVMVPFSLIITIRDIDGEQPVYNQMSQLMDQYNWDVSNLVVDTQIQV
jgi:hypothetical protein